jgi:hypothetical protein
MTGGLESAAKHAQAHIVAERWATNAAGRAGLTLPTLRLAADAISDPRDDGQDDGANDGGHEVVDAESRRKPRRQLEHDGIENDEEEPERDNRQRQREKKEDRPHDRIQQAEDQCRDREGHDRMVVKPGHERHDDEEREGVEQPSEEEVHVAYYARPWGRALSVVG